MLDVKLQPIISQLYASLGVTSSDATSQQGGYGFAYVSINNPYVIPLMMKKPNAPNIVMAGRSLRRLLEDITIEIPDVSNTEGTSSIRILSYTEVDPNDEDAEKEAKLKKD